jgi:hypothetical protein
MKYMNFISLFLKKVNGCQEVTKFFVITIDFNNNTDNSYKNKQKMFIYLVSYVISPLYNFLLHLRYC